VTIATNRISLETVLFMRIFKPLLVFRVPVSYFLFKNFLHAIQIRQKLEYHMQRIVRQHTDARFRTT